MVRMVILAAMLTFAAQMTYAQTFEAGIFVGAATYNGDIDVTTQNWGSSLRPALGLIGKYRLNDAWLLRGQFVSGTLAVSEKNSDIAWQRERGFSFRNRVKELSFMVERSLMNIGKFQLYGFGGVALAFHKPQTDYNNGSSFFNDVQNSDSQSNKSTTSFVLPLGMGLKYHFAPKWTLAVEASVRKTFTDYLDGVSNLGNPDRNDAYMFTGVSVFYEFGFGKSAKNRDFKNGLNTCPKF